MKKRIIFDKNDDSEQV